MKFLRFYPDGRSLLLGFLDNCSQSKNSLTRMIPFRLRLVSTCVLPSVLIVVAGVAVSLPPAAALVKDEGGRMSAQRSEGKDEKGQAVGALNMEVKSISTTVGSSQTTPFYPSSLRATAHADANIPHPSLLAQSPAPISRYDVELLRLTNAERQRAGVPALRFSGTLGRAAQGHAEDMVRNRFFSHTGSNGSSMVERAQAVGYRYSFLGENIAAGRATPAETVRQWMQSPGHRRNILNPSFTEIGFGYRAASDRYGHYWVQVFGTPMR